MELGEKDRGVREEGVEGGSLQIARARENCNLGAAINVVYTECSLIPRPLSQTLRGWEWPGDEATQNTILFPCNK